MSEITYSMEMLEDLLGFSDHEKRVTRVVSDGNHNTVTFFFDDGTDAVLKAEYKRGIENGEMKLKKLKSVIGCNGVNSA